MEMDVDTILSQVDDKISKAVTATTYTMSPPTRSIYSPENLDPVIKHLVPTTAPVRNIFPRTAGFGQIATWRKLTSRLDPQAGGTGTRVGFADAGTPSSTTQTYSLATAAYKNLGRDVEIGRQQIANNRGSALEDVRMHEEKIKALEVVLGEEDCILNGDTVTTSTEFDGLAKSITTNSGSASLLTSSGVSSYAQTLYTAGADNPTHLVCSARENRALADDLQGSGSIQRIVVDNQGSAQGGVHLSEIVNAVSGSMIKIVTSRYVGAYAYLLTVTDLSGENWVEMEDLESMSVYDVPTANHSLVSRVYETCVLKVIGEPFQYKISGLA
jgi:hypothetical protein